MNHCLDTFDELYRWLQKMLHLVSTPLLDNPFRVTIGTICFFVYFNTVALSATYTIYAYETSVGLFSSTIYAVWIQVERFFF